MWSAPKSKTWNRSPGGSVLRPGTPSSITKQPPGSRCAATFSKHATCASCVVRLPIVLKTMYASENVPSTRVVAKSPIVAPIRSAPGFSRSFATIASERSIPCTRTPRSDSGSAIRPVPIPSSSAAPSPARAARKSTAGSSTSGSNMSAADSS